MEVDTISDDSMRSNSRKLVCPRGRKIVSNLQAQLYMNDTLDSTCSNADDVPSEANSTVNSDTLSSSLIIAGRSHKQEDKMKYIRESNRQWAAAETALGGPYNHFKERKEFRPQFSALRDDDVDENIAPDRVVDVGEAEMPVDKIPSPGPSSSQGRYGQGCSTPQRMNNTFAPLRQLEVSAVVPLDQTVDKENALREVASSVMERDPTPQPVTFAKPNLKVKSERAPPSSKADDSMSDVIASFSSKPKQAKISDDKASTRQPSISSEDSNISTGSTFVLPNTVYSSDVDIPPNNTTRSSSSAKSVDSATFTVPKEVEHNSSTFIVGKESTSAEGDDGTFTVENQGSTPPENNGTFTIANNRTFSKENSGTFTKDNNETFEIRNESNKTNVTDKMESTAKPNGKVKLEDRKSRDMKAMTSHQLNHSKSILADVSVGMVSPGSVKFASRPSKRNCVLVTPSHLRLQNKDNIAELSINLSPVSHVASLMDVDDSMIDPVTDPRSLTTDSPVTPTRSVQHKPRSLTKNVEGAKAARQGPTSVTGTTPYNSPLVEKLEADPTPSTSFSRAERPRPQFDSENRLSTPKPLPGYCRPTSASLGKAKMSAGRSSIGRTFTTRGMEDNYDSPVLNIDPSRLIEENLLSGVRPRVNRKPIKNSLLARSMFSNIPVSQLDDLRRDNILAREQKDIDRTPKAGSISRASLTEQPKTVNSAQSSNQVNEEYVDQQLIRSTGSLSLDEVPQKAASPSEQPEIPVFDDFGGDSFSDDHCGGDVSDDQDGGAPLQLSDPVGNQPNRNLMLLSDSVCSQSSPRAELRSSNYRIVTSSEQTRRTSCYGSTDDESLIEITAAHVYRKSADEFILKPLKLIQPEKSDYGLRRSKRTRIPPVRRHMGEQPKYQASPSGNRLVGVSKVIIDKRYAKHLNYHRTQAINSHKRAMNKRTKELKEPRRRRNLDDSDN